MKQEQEKEIIHIDVDSEKFPTLKAGNDYSINGVVISISGVSKIKTHKYYDGTVGDKSFTKKDLHQVLSFCGISRKGCTGATKVGSTGRHKGSLLKTADEVRQHASATYDCYINAIEKVLTKLTEYNPKAGADVGQLAIGVTDSIIAKKQYISLMVKAWELAAEERAAEAKAAEAKKVTAKAASKARAALAVLGKSEEEINAILG